MNINYIDILNSYTTQVADSVLSEQDNNLEQVQDTSSSVMFGMQPQNLMSVESVDTIAEVVPVPRTLRTVRKLKVVEEQNDTLKYFTEYVNQLTVLKLDNSSLPLLNNLFIVKPVLAGKYKNLIAHNREITTPKVKLKKLQQPLITENVIIPKKEKKIANEAPIKKEVIKVIEVKPKENIASISDYKPNIWVAGVVIFSVFVFAWLRLFHYKNYNEILKSGYNYNNSAKLFKEGNSASQRVGFLLNTVFTINLSLFLFLAIGYLNIMQLITDFKLFMVLFGVITLTYFIKSIIIKTIGFIFSSDVVASEYNSNVLLYNKILGLALFPIIIALPYINIDWKLPVIYTGFFLVSTFFIFRLVRSFQIVFRIKLSIIYWILYLCTLEILPVFILSKILYM